MEGRVTNVTKLYERFRAYHIEHPAWGSLHVVLDDENIDDACVRHCREWALEQGDEEGAELAELLARMSEGQRLKISENC